LESALIASVDVMARAYGVGLLGTIEKPVTPGKLSAMLESLVRGTGARGDADTQAFTLEEIAEGLERNEFEPFFQPKVDLRTRIMKGAEALARWRHPTLGIIRPAAFVAAMEKGGMIDHLTRIIIEGAILNCAMWRAGRLDAGVAINLSPRSLQDFGFINWLIDRVHRAGLEPGHVTFEITESVALGSLGASLETLSRLRMKGFGLSIDDYGTGHSSMERLSQIPFTELKIDQGFVRKAATEASSRAVLESSLEMAQKLGITAVAEGVESRQEWDLVRTLGCDLAQGYLIAPPMDAVEFARWVRTPLQIRA
jgi:EAL domain-containing protein (putative c-di-GMP-specific phosphodiesterase class I)